MSPFEYITVLISIILGMGLTQLVSGFAAIIIRWEKIKVYWPHLVLILLVFVIQIQEWWATYELHRYPYWRLVTILFIVLYPIDLYLLARILFPIRWSGKEIDLKLFYFNNFRKIYLLIMFLPIHSIIENIFLSGYQLKDQVIQIILFLIAGFMAAANRKEEWIHKLVATILLTIAVGTFVVAWNIFLIFNS
jgi:hypothetical protein